MVKKGALTNNLYVLRAEKKWTQKFVAEQLDVTRQTIHALESNKYNPSLALRHKHDERFQSIVLKGFYLSWFISYLGVTTGFSLSMLSFVNLPENMALNICMFSVLLSGIFNGLYVYISHKRF